MKKIPVIIDCDPGYDDALALVLALAHDKLDVKAITTTAGNIKIERTYKNAIRICRFLDKDIRIGKGAKKPLFKEPEFATYVHSETGLSGANIPEDVPMPLEENTISVIKNELENSKEKITLIVLGPLTNIALLFQIYPSLKEKIESIVIMGGAAVGGNITPSAEFNIYADAEAAKIVFEAGIPIIMAGLDITNEFQIYQNEFDDYKKLGHVGIFVSEILEAYYNFYKTIGSKFKGPAIHDLLPIAYVIDPSLFEGEDYHVDVECKGEYTYGQTVVDFMGINKNRNVKVLQSCNRESIIHMFKEAISQY